VRRLHGGSAPQYGPEPEGVTLRLSSNPHDFGTYREVKAVFDPTDQVAAAWAYKAENGVATWLEVKMWKPVSYNACQPIHIIREPAMWCMEHNPRRYTTAAQMALATAPASPETTPA
jgi:hypothetical protein